MFFDPIRVKLNDDGDVVFAIRSNDGRVDEYTIAFDLFDQFAREPLVLDTWVGPEKIQAKDHGDYVSIAICYWEGKRDIFRVKLPQYHIMIALFFAAVSDSEI
jgi:hypothetical protein